MRDRELHFTDDIQSAWLVERRTLARRFVEDGFFFENVPQFPVQARIIDPLASDIFTVVIKTGPQMIGEPHLRSRLHAYGLNLHTCIWTGPSTSEAAQQDFNERFDRGIAMTGDAFMLLDESARRQVLAAKAKNQG